MNNEIKHRAGERGSMLVIVFVMIAFISLLFTLTIDRFNNEKRLTEAHYYENVTLDLAESGLYAAEAELKKGSSRSEFKIDMGKFRNMSGTAQTSVKKGDNGYEIASLGVLTDASGEEKFSKKLEIVGHFESSGAGRVFRIDSWKEL